MLRYVDHHNEIDSDRRLFLKKCFRFTDSWKHQRKKTEISKEKCQNNVNRRQKSSSFSSMVRATITDQSALRGENWCNSKFPEEYDLEIFRKWPANPLVSVSWNGLQKRTGSLRNSGRRRCRSDFNSWQLFAPRIRVLLFVVDSRQQTTLDLPQICAERFLKSFQSWKYKLKSEK